MKLLFDERMTVPRGFVVPPEMVVWPAALKTVTAISSALVAELMSSTGTGIEERLLSFSKASVGTFPLCSRLLSPKGALMAFRVAVFPKNII